MPLSMEVTTWFTVIDSSGRILRAEALPPGADLPHRLRLAHRNYQLQGWIVDALLPRHCGFTAEKSGRRILIEIRPPPVDTVAGSRSATQSSQCRPLPQLWVSRPVLKFVGAIARIDYIVCTRSRRYRSANEVKLPGSVYCGANEGSTQLHREDNAVMEPQFRETRLTDIYALFELRGRTRQHPLSREALAKFGITPESTARDLIAGNIWGSVCTHDTRIVGFCTGDMHTGEILVLAVLPDYEGHGIGKRLLSRVVHRLLATGDKRIWLAASADPAVRAHGFYRAQGWKPNGQRMSNGDEILELHLDSIPTRDS